jgi:hypothetical protein
LKCTVLERKNIIPMVIRYFIGETRYLIIVYVKRLSIEIDKITILLRCQMVFPKELSSKNLPIRKRYFYVVKQGTSSLSAQKSVLTKRRIKSSPYQLIFSKHSVM